jgi:NAD(P)-dependent dehydrogenase (short-subunit alcohol dehydrogenase family)
MSLNRKTVLITGAARRIGRFLALAVARAGADVIIHFGNSRSEAESAQAEIQTLGRKAFLLQADLADPIQVAGLMARAREFGPVYALVNNAAIFEPLTWDNSNLESWNHHLMVNLTVPFLLSQAFARFPEPKENRRIVNLLDWRAQRPGADHLPYTISKATAWLWERYYLPVTAQQMRLFWIESRPIAGRIWKKSARRCSFCWMAQPT